MKVKIFPLQKQNLLDMQKNLLYRGVFLLLLLLSAPALGHAQLGDFFTALRETAREGFSPAKLGTKPVSAAQLVGTWAYSEPVLVFENTNLASQLGAAMASGELKEKMAACYAKAGIVPQKMLLTFKPDGRYQVVIHDETLDGTYKVKGATLTLSDPMKKEVIQANVARDGHELQIVVKADRFVGLVQSLSTVTTSAGASAQSLIGVLKEYAGLQMGIVLRKQQ